MKAKYISDIHDTYLKKGKVYDVFYPLDDSRKLLLGYDDPCGEQYAVPADRFEIIDDEKQYVPLAERMQQQNKYFHVTPPPEADKKTEQDK